MALQGTGTQANPYLIGTLEDLREFSESPTASTYWAAGKYTKLTADIDCTGMETWNGGTGFKAVTGYSGIFDGRFRNIQNFFASKDSSLDAHACFFYTTFTGSQIKNLSFSNIFLKAYQSGSSRGSIISSLATGTAISYIVVLSGTIESNGSLYNGSIVGQAPTQDINMSRCYSYAHVISDSGAGGLVGRVGSGLVAECFFAGTITSLYGNGVVGSGITAPNSYYDTTLAGNRSNDGGIGKTMTEMKTQSTYVGWDFDNVWFMEEGQYPQLRAFIPLAITADPTAVYALAGDVVEMSAVVSGGQSGGETCDIGKSYFTSRGTNSSDYYTFQNAAISGNVITANSNSHVRVRPLIDGNNSRTKKAIVEARVYNDETYRRASSDFEFGQASQYGLRITVRLNEIWVVWNNARTHTIASAGTIDLKIEYEELSTQSRVVLTENGAVILDYLTGTPTLSTASLFFSFEFQEQNSTCRTDITKLWLESDAGVLPNACFGSGIKLTDTSTGTILSTSSPYSYLVNPDDAGNFFQWEATDGIDTVQSVLIPVDYVHLSITSITPDSVVAAVGDIVSMNCTIAGGVSGNRGAYLVDTSNNNILFDDAPVFPFEYEAKLEDNGKNFQWVAIDGYDEVHSDLIPLRISTEKVDLGKGFGVSLTNCHLSSTTFLSISGLLILEAPSVYTVALPYVTQTGETILPRPPKGTMRITSGAQSITIAGAMVYDKEPFTERPDQRSYLFPSGMVSSRDSGLENIAGIVKLKNVSKSDGDALRLFIMNVLNFNENSFTLEVNL